MYIKKIEESIPSGKIANAHYEGQDKTYSCDYINKNKETYSTEEIRIGTWIDGKPLYRKVIVFPNGIGTTEPTVYNLSDFGIENADEIYIGIPSYYSLPRGEHFPFQFYDGLLYTVNVNRIQIRMQLQFQEIADSRCVLTLEYTKTTD